MLIYLRIGPQIPNHTRTTAGCCCPSLSMEGGACLNSCATSTSAELSAIWLELHGLHHHCHSCKVTDFRDAIQLLGSVNEATLLASTVANTCRNLEDAGWTLILQWMPSHVGIPGNEKTDFPASGAHHDGRPTFLLRRFAEVKRFIKAIVNPRHPD